MPKNLPKTGPSTEAEPLSVAEYVDFLNSELRQYEARVAGEVGRVTVAASGHVYFSLKDRDQEYTLNCIIWRNTYSLFGIELAEGMELVVGGRPRVYPVRGDLSFIADTIELVGEGKLRKEYERLKKKLAAEGLFAPERKRPVPLYPRDIGVVTSRHGAVIGDFLSNLGRFGFRVKMVDSPVEGQKAVKPLLAALRTFSRLDIEVLALIRGGGSMESLLAFDNEKLVRAVADFPVPVIAGIGHHKDVPLAALAADSMESTPTAATKALNRSWEEAGAKVERHGYRIIESFNAAARQAGSAIADSGSRAARGFQAALADCGRRIAYYDKVIQGHDPRKNLELGYSIATVKGRVVRKVGQLKAGGGLELRLSDGRADATVNKINKDNNYGQPEEK